MQIKTPTRYPLFMTAVKIKGLLAALKKEHAEKITEVTETWDKFICQFSFKYSGMHISGTILVEVTEVTITGELPVLALLYKDKIESNIREHAENLLK